MVSYPPPAAAQLYSVSIRQHRMAIQGFKSKALQRFSEQDDARRLPKQHLARIVYILDALAGEQPLRVLRQNTAYRLHRLTGDRKGVWSVLVAARLRITFR